MMMRCCASGILIVLSLGCSACPEQLISLLHKHVHCLRIVCKTKCSIDIASFLQDNAIGYRHELTRLAFKKIGIQGNLIPLFESWDLFLQRYRLVDSELFVREFSIILFFVYKNIFAHYNSMKVSMDEILHLSSQIMSLPIDQVLTALERCYHQFVHIMSEYGMQPGIPLSVWIRRYWWVPPIVILSFVYSTVRHFLFAQGSTIEENWLIYHSDTLPGLGL